jgi:hypothetical protein
LLSLLTLTASINPMPGAVLSGVIIFVAWLKKMLGFGPGRPVLAGG